MSELKPCPHCGREAKLIHHRSLGKMNETLHSYYVVCNPCAYTTRATKEDAIAKWNTRHPDPTINELVKALEVEHWAKVRCIYSDYGVTGECPTCALIRRAKGLCGTV